MGRRSLCNAFSTWLADECRDPFAGSERANRVAAPRRLDDKGRGEKDRGRHRSPDDRDRARERRVVGTSRSFSHSQGVVRGSALLFEAPFRFALPKSIIGTARETARVILGKNLHASFLYQSKRNLAGAWAV